MTSAAAFAELCPGCFNGKGNTSICPRCGYDEGLKRGPLFLPHRTLLHHGQYLIGKVLGKPGGFGITYLALDTKLETKVAIKEYLPRDLAGRDAGHATISVHSEEDGEFFRYGLTQFLQEARTLAQFDHANIVRVRNFFEENGTGYLVMDYYDGITLADYLAQQPQGRLIEKTAVGILMPILDGLREVHAKNFLHRDIKPQNIYLTTANRPILLDFGAARQAMGERSRSLSVVLSEGYAPYEQYHRRGEQGPWTDIYACAAVLYHAVAGEAPPPATERVHKDELDIAALGVSASLADALRLGLATDHHNRPQRMKEFQALLLGGCEPSSQSTVEPKPKKVDLSVPAEIVAPRPVEPVQSKSSSGLGVWWAPVLAVVIVIAMMVEGGQREKISQQEKKNMSTADSSAAVASEPGLRSGTAFNHSSPPLVSPVTSGGEDPETALWQSVERSTSKDDYDTYLMQYPKGKFPALAESRIEKMQSETMVREAVAREQSAWEAAERTNNEETYRRYQSEYPTGKHAGPVAARLKQIEAEAALRAETAQWQRADETTGSAAVQGYLDRYPAGRFIAEARLKLAAIKKKDEELRTETELWRRADTATDSASVQGYLERYPAGRYVAEARLKLAAMKKKDEELSAETDLWQRANAATYSAGVQGYLDRYPAGRYVAEARLRLAAVKKLEEMRPGRVFKDCAICPEMVVIPAGRFTMGSPVSEATRDSDEGPQHTVTISRPFAAGKFEVTFVEWEACRSEGGCDRDPYDSGWGKGRRPVINVSLKDAKEYVKWLSIKTGKNYRLLTESEWEYIARAGTTTAFSTGPTINPSQANYDGEVSYAGSVTGAYLRRTQNVGQYQPNAFGLYDVHGNVSEWVEDCWNSNYNGAPSDGGAWTTGECNWPILRGGSFYDSPRNLRSAIRKNVADFGILARSQFSGFRVARYLP